MNICRILSMIPLAALAFSAAALDVESTPGALSSLVEDTSVSDLSVSGSIDAADFDFIAYSLPDLRTLDLSGVTIAAYSGDRLVSGLTTSPAGYLPTHALFGSPVTQVTLPPTLLGIGDAAFAASAVTSVSIPASVTSVGEAAFAGCTALTTLTIPAGVTSLGSHLADGATALTTATLSANITALPAYTFNGCTALTTVTLRPSLTSIGDYAFNGCSALTTLRFPTALRTIGDFAFNASGLTDADLLGSISLTAIGSHAFGECKSLTAVSLPESLSTIGQGAFFMDTALASVSLPESVTVISALAFAGDAAITDADAILPASVSTIGERALSGLSAVSEAHLPPSLSSLGDRAMERWTALTTLDASDVRPVPALGADVWYGIDPSAVKLKVDKDYLDDYKAADQWRDFDIEGVISTRVEVVVDSDEAALSAFFSGADLNVIASFEMDTVMLYDAAGALLVTLSPADSVAVISTDSLATDLYIIVVDSVDGLRHSLKILRR